MKRSTRLYQLLLKLYPREHRRQYGELMVTHFNDQLREARTDRAVLRLWLLTLVDVARSAPHEHAAAARMQKVTPWPMVLIAILPGVLPFLLSPTADSLERLALLILGAIYLLILLHSLWRKQPYDWILPMVGLTGSYAVFWLIYVLLEPFIAYGQILLVTIFAAGVVMAPVLRKVGGRKTALLGACFAATFLIGLAWNRTGILWAHGEGMEAAAVIMLAVALGLPFARRYGLLGALFLAGSLHWAILMALEPSLLVRFGAWSHVLSLLNFITAIVIIPLLALRARCPRTRALALLGPLAAYLLLLVVFPPLAYSLFAPGANAGIVVLLQQALGRAIFSAQILAGTAFGLSLYHDYETSGSLHPFFQRRHPTQIHEAP